LERGQVRLLGLRPRRVPDQLRRAGRAGRPGRRPGPGRHRRPAARPGGAALELTLANEGREPVSYTLTPNDYEGRAQTLTVQAGGSSAISWPADQDGYYDVVITAGASGGFRRRYAGRIA
jgi:phospholipase C